MIAGMNQIPIWVEGISCIVGGSQHHKVTLRGGLHYDVGHDEGWGGGFTLGQLQFLHVVDYGSGIEGLLLETCTQRRRLMLTTRVTHLSGILTTRSVNYHEKPIKTFAEPSAVLYSRRPMGGLGFLHSGEQQLWSVWISDRCNDKEKLLTLDIMIQKNIFLHNIVSVCVSSSAYGMLVDIV